MEWYGLPVPVKILPSGGRTDSTHFPVLGHPLGTEAAKITEFGFMIT